MDTQVFAGKVAVVTGGTGGIGGAVARAVAGRGAQVLVTGRDANRGASVVQTIQAEGGTAAFVSADLTSEAGVARVFGEAEARFGGVDLLFNNAGIAGKPLGKGPDEAAEDVVDQLLATNVKAVFYGMQHAGPKMKARGGGVIVNTASVVGTVVPIPNSSLYGGTKAAIVSMTRAYAAAVADHGVKVYAICPWIADTAMMDEVTDHQGRAAKEGIAAHVNPSGKIVNPDEIAAVVVSLFAGTASFATGSAILVDSGPSTRLLGIPA